MGNPVVLFSGVKRYMYIVEKCVYRCKAFSTDNFVCLSACVCNRYDNKLAERLPLLGFLVFFEFIIRIFFNVQIICNNIFFGGSEPASANLSVCPLSVLMSVCSIWVFVQLAPISAD